MHDCWASGASFVAQHTERTAPAKLAAFACSPRLARPSNGSSNPRMSIGISFLYSHGRRPLSALLTP